MNSILVDALSETLYFTMNHSAMLAKIKKKVVPGIQKANLVIFAVSLNLPENYVENVCASGQLNHLNVTFTIRLFG